MIKQLKENLLFERLTLEQLERVARLAEHMHLKEGAHLFEQDDEAKRFYLILTGQIKLFRLSPDGNEKVIEIFTAGQTFGEALMFLERPRYPVCASALNDTEIISLNSKDFVSMLKESIDSCFLLMGVMSLRLHGLIREIDVLSLQNGTRRVASYLLELAGTGQDSFDLHIPKGVMASRLSLKPETFSRIIRDLHDRGILTVTRRNIKIHKRGELQAISDACKI
ncbi:MAG: Crp/Fnr family transcriptional regulator [Gammaproteobacteria bacterium]|nr:Crp/Fnr family transcriptional regulator [Gammaproteobacteria bacterium]